MKSPLSLLAALCLTAFYASGCATIISGSSQKIPIASNPSGATVTIDSLPAGTTPLVADLSRKRLHRLKIELPGYFPYEEIISQQVNSVVFANILLGGIIGAGVDIATGASNNLTPDGVRAELRKMGAGDSIATPTSTPFANERFFNAPFDSVWAASLDAVTGAALPLKYSDKEKGIIETNSRESGAADLEKFAKFLEPVRYASTKTKLTLTLQAVGATQTKVKIQPLIEGLPAQTGIEAPDWQPYSSSGAVESDTFKRIEEKLKP